LVVKGQVELAAVRLAYRGEHRDQVGQVAPDERLAAGDPQLPHSERDEDPGRSLDLLERQDLVAREERVVLAKDLLGHAIRAPEVAPIGDRDAQVVDRPAERVERAGRVIGGRRGIHPQHGSPERIQRPPARTKRRPGGTTGVRGWYHQPTAPYQPPLPRCDQDADAR